MEECNGGSSLPLQDLQAITLLLIPLNNILLNAAKAETGIPVTAVIARVKEPHVHNHTRSICRAIHRNYKVEVKKTSKK